MKKYVLLIVFACSFLSAFSQEEVTTYYLIRHAEKNRTDKNDKDPHLTYEGIKRAENWAEVLSTVQFDLVYTTDYNRTKETALPTAEKNGLQLFVYDANNMYDEGFKYNTNGKHVLVVGHSNTIPNFVNKIIGKDTYKEIDDANNSNLYIVTVTKDCVTDVVLKIDFTLKKQPE